MKNYLKLRNYFIPRIKYRLKKKLSKERFSSYSRAVTELLLQLTLANLCRENVSSQSAIPNEEIRSKFDVWVSSQLNNLNFHVMSPTLSNAVSQRLSSSPKKDSDLQQSMLQNQLTQKTRMRTSFDPELELPKLQKWFLENQHPSRQQVGPSAAGGEDPLGMRQLFCPFQIQQYVKELNGLESRRGRKPLDINNVVYWFKNARAAQKRAELRGFCTPLLNMNVNGFHGFHSPIRYCPHGRLPLTPKTGRDRVFGPFQDAAPQPDLLRSAFCIRGRGFQTFRRQRQHQGHRHQ